jgi:hypothetical protein
MGFGEMLSCIPKCRFDTQSLHVKSLMIDQLELKANFSKTREHGLIGNGVFEAENPGRNMIGRQVVTEGAVEEACQKV